MQRLTFLIYVILLNCVRLMGKVQFLPKPDRLLAFVPE
jgi:hypothetical protein